MKAPHMLRQALFLLTLGSLLFLGGVASADEARQAKRSHIDLVIALDTSNSMDGLINSARQKIWDIVNELATAKPTPILRVGLISYGNDSYHEAGWTRVDQNLTDDLDTVYDKLMELRTNGGSEYVGRAIHTANTQMNWRPDRKTLKMIFVAGNESADQDREVPSLQAAKSIISNKDVIVNTIYCGNPQDNISEGWRQVALKADGQFTAIAPDGGAVVISTPYDDELAKLGNQLNSTYIAYGRRGRAAKVKQAEQDKKAADMSSSAGASRAAAKSTALYRNSKWDLVDAEAEGISMEDMDQDELPEEMQKMSAPERKKFVAGKAKDRKKIQKKIKALNKKRNEYIAKETRKLNKGKGNSFDGALKKALRSQAKRKAINF